MSLGKNLTPEQKAEIMAQVVETDEGKVALAQAMIEPIRRSLEYQAIGRKLLLVDMLPQGAIPRYERDVAVAATVISRKGGVPVSYQEGEEVLVPTYEIAAYPSVRLSEIRARRFYIVDRAQIKAKEALQKQEDTDIFSALLAAATSSGQIVLSVGSLTVPAINDAFRYIERHDLVTARLVMHADQYATIRNFGKDFYDEATVREIITTGLFGHLYTADLHVSSRMPTDTVLVVATAETVGAFPIRQDITVLPADDPRNLRLGWVIYEEIGIVVLNAYAAAKITVSSSTS